MTPIQLLRKYAFFQAFDTTALAIVSQATDEIVCAPSEVLFECEQPADVLYLLIDGALELWIVATGRNGNRRYLPAGEVRQGDVAGVSALVPPYVYTATGQITKPSRLIKIDAPTLRDLAEHDPRLDSALMHIVAEATMRRLHDARTQLVLNRK